MAARGRRGATELVDRETALARLREGRAAAIPDAAHYVDHLRREVMTNVLRSFAPPAIEVPTRSFEHDPLAWARAVSAILAEAGAGFVLSWSSDEPSCPLHIGGATGDEPPTEYGTFVPAQQTAADDLEPVDWERLVTVLADVGFLVAVYYKVSRLSVVGDPSLYPFWIAGRRALRRRHPHRPEVGVHHRFLQDLTPRREARLYRALTPRWEVRRDRVVGERRWRGRRMDDPEP